MLCQCQTCMAEVAPLHEVILDDGEVLLDEGRQGGALAVRPQLLSSIQRVGVLRGNSMRHEELVESVMPQD